MKDARLLQVVLEVLDAGIAILNWGDHYLYRNHRFLELTRGPETPLNAVVQSVRQELLAREQFQPSAFADGPTVLRSENVHIGNGGYCVRGFAIGSGCSGGASVLLITIEHLSQEAGRRLPDEFRLTAQEARVARLLAGGCTNKEIATVLGIHPTTAKNHTQSVLQKLGVRRRSQVGPLLRTRLPK